jgi:hypothetical protein
MTSTNETEIEKKKSQNTQQPDDVAKKNTVQFISAIVKGIVFLGVLTILGSATLYSTKVAQANAIPTLHECKPFTDILPKYTTPDGTELKFVDVYINMIKEKDEVFAQQIQFNYEDNSKNAILDFLHKIREKKEKLSSIKIYFVTIFETIISFIYMVLNAYLQLIGDYLPETVIILVTPFITALLFGVLVVVSWIYLFCLFFINIFTLFKRYNEKTDSLKLHIVSLDMITGGMIATLICILVIMFGINLSFVSMFLIVYCCLSILTSSFKPKNGNENDVYTFKNAIMDVFKYKKIVFSVILTLLVVLTAFISFGSAGGIFCLISVVLIYYKIIPISLFSTLTRDKTFELVKDFVDPLKECVVPQSPV